MNTWQILQQHPALWQRYLVREKVLRAIRAFFEERNFHEVETPLLIAHPPAESYLDVFETSLLDRSRNPRKAYLSTSPEVPLKKLIVAGLGDCFALTKSFRNMETQGILHNPEFTILEWYRRGVDYRAIMDDCEKLLRFIYQRMHDVNTSDELSLTYNNQRIRLDVPWERLTMVQAFSKWANIDFIEFLDMKNAIAIAKKKGYTVEPETTWEALYNQIFLNEVEPHLGRNCPTILYEFPGTMAALAKTKATDPRFAERFEFYIGGLELGDCYSELTDWREQQKRFENELREIRKAGKTLYEYDKDFIRALQAGLPECSGIAIGVDRLVMLFSGVATIQETLFFPADEMFRDSK